MADIDFGRISESLNEKSDRDLRNVDNTAGADAVIDYQEPTSANNYTWYRKYKSGWVEQGGTIVVGSSNQQYTISLPYAMATTEHTLLRNSKNTGISDYASFIAGYTNKTITNFSFYAVGSYGQQDWCVYGIAAN